MSKKNKTKEIRVEFKKGTEELAKISSIIEEFGSKPSKTSAIILNSAHGGRFKVKKGDIKKFTKSDVNSKYLKKFNKARKYICPHIAFTKNGKIRHITDTTGDGRVRCGFCNVSFPMTPESAEQVDKMFKPIDEALQRSKFMISAIGGSAVEMYPVNVSMIVVLERMKVMLKLLNTYASKAVERRPKKKKDNRNRNNSGWEWHYNN